MLNLMLVSDRKPAGVCANIKSARTSNDRKNQAAELMLNYLTFVSVCVEMTNMQRKGDCKLADV